MTKDELRERHPELYAQLMAALDGVIKTAPLAMAVCDKHVTPWYVRLYRWLMK